MGIERKEDNRSVSGLVLAAVVLALLCAPASGRAQSPLPTAGFDDGFFVQSADGENRLVFGAVVQADGRFATDGASSITNAFLIRRMRPTLTGRFGRYFQFKVMPDFGLGTPVIQDAYLDLRLSPAFAFRAGKNKTPVGYEVLIGDAYLVFPERSLASNLVPNRDVGFEGVGTLWAGRVEYAAGVFNGIADGVGVAPDVDVNDGKDLAGRIVVRPFRHGAGSGALRDLGVHLGGTSARDETGLPSMHTSAATTWFTYGRDVVADGSRQRLAPAVFLYHRGFGGFVEYVQSTQRFTQGGATTDITNRGWDATASFLLTGEAASEGAVRPNHPLDPATGGSGAWQIAARYATVAIDGDAFAHGLAGLTAAGQAREYGIGLNWFPLAIVKYYGMFEHTSFSGGAGAKPSENLVIVRAQLAF